MNPTGSFVNTLQIYYNELLVIFPLKQSYWLLIFSHFIVLSHNKFPKQLQKMNSKKVMSNSLMMSVIYERKFPINFSTKVMTNANNNFIYGHECSNHITQIIKKNFIHFWPFTRALEKCLKLKQKTWIKYKNTKPKHLSAINWFDNIRKQKT